jgi:hypothetical protein
MRAKKTEFCGQFWTPLLITLGAFWAGSLPPVNPLHSTPVPQVDGVLANAGGLGATPGALHASGCISLYADNLLGHAALIEGLIKHDKLPAGAVVVYAGSEMSRGVSKMVRPWPEMHAFPPTVARPCLAYSQAVIMTMTPPPPPLPSQTLHAHT